MGRWGTWGACGCCTTAGFTITVTVSGQGNFPAPKIPGATVTLSVGGTTVATGTANSSGVATLTAPAASYTMTTSACLHQTDTRTLNVTGNTNTSVSLLALATTHITDSNGSHLASFGTAPSGSNFSGALAWVVCYTFSSGNCATVNGSICATAQTGNVAVRHVITYSVTPTAVQSESSWLYTTCSAGGGHGLTPSSCSSNNLTQLGAGSGGTGGTVGGGARVFANAPNTTDCAPLSFVFSPNYLNSPPNGSNQGTDQPISGNITMVT